MGSIWVKTEQLPQFNPLPGDLNTDVLVIGGGLAGLLCTWQFSQAGINCALVEANRLCSGITKNTTAKVTSQHGLIYHKLIQEFGVDTALLYLQANQNALARLRKFCQTVDVDFTDEDAFVYSIDDKQKIDKELVALEKIGFSAEFRARLPLPFPIAGAVRFPGQAQFYPLKFTAVIAKNLRIFERTKVLELMPKKAFTDRGTISAEKIIIATHFPILNKHGGYFLKLYQHRSYVLALKNAPHISGMYVDESKKGLTFRSANDLLLLGGGSHRTGQSGGGWKQLEAFVHRYYPDARETARWATQDCMSLDGIPYIGQYAKRTPDLYVATGFNKWGMTSSMVAAMILVDLVQEHPNPYASAFSPNRTVFRPQLAVNSWESIRGLLTPGSRRCPHMGCALKYNYEEHSWDCPCHGSRFSADGELIDNPATDDRASPPS